MSSVGGQRGVLEAARALRAAGQGFALALVTDTEGSTYRKAGALALVAGNGQRTGTLSGGCLEPALEALAARVIASGVPEAAVFDTGMPDFVVMISTLGGMAVFGINGFVIGPVIAAMFFAVWHIYVASRAS